MAEHMYERIASVLREQILSGQLSPGQRLPTQDALSELFEVSRVVARQALELLESEGLVSRGKGAGTFVREYEPLVRRSALHYKPDPGAPFAEESIGAERVPRFSHATRRDRAGVEVAQRLNIGVGDELMVTEYVSYTNDVPVMATTSYEPLALTRGTPIERPEDGPFPPAAGVIDRFTSIGLRPVRIDERVRCRMPRPSEVELLDLKPGVPVILIARVSVAERGPIETADLILASDQFELYYPMAVPPTSAR